MAGGGFLDLGQKVSEGWGAGKDVRGDASGAPLFTIRIDFNLNNHD
jgi:hypothetical protein